MGGIHCFLAFLLILTNYGIRSHEQRDSCVYKSPPTREELQFFFDRELLGRSGLLVRSKVPGVLVTVAVNGTTLFTRAYSPPTFYNRFPLTTQSYWPGAQLSEVISTITIIHALEQHNPPLRPENVRIVDYLPWLPSGMKLANITVHDLLWHVSGLDNTETGLWSKEPHSKDTGTWEEELRGLHRFFTHAVRSPGIVATETPFDVSLAAAVAERIACSGNSSCSFRVMFSDTLHKLGMSSATLIQPDFGPNGVDKFGRRLALGFLESGKPMEDRGALIRPPEHHLYPSYGMWLTGNDYETLVRSLSAMTERGDDVLSASVRAAMLSTDASWSPLSDDHPLKSLVPGTGAAFQEKEIYGYMARVVNSRHIGHGNYLICVLEEDPLLQGSGPGGEVGQSYRLCLGIAATQVASRFVDTLVQDFFYSTLYTHYGCLRRDEDLEPTLGPFSAGDFRQVYRDTRLSRSGRAAVRLPFFEQKLELVRVPSTDEASSGWTALFPCFSRINQSTQYAALPLNWLDPVRDRQILPGQREKTRDVAAVFPAYSANPSRWSYVMRNRQGFKTVDDQNSTDGLHIAAATAIQLQCRSNSTFSESCSAYETESSGAHANWLSGRTRFFLNGRRCIEQVGGIETGPTFTTISAILIMISVLIVPALLGLIDWRQRKAAIRDEANPRRPPFPLSNSTQRGLDSAGDARMIFAPQISSGRGVRRPRGERRHVLNDRTPLRRGRAKRAHRSCHTPRILIHSSAAAPAAIPQSQLMARSVSISLPLAMAISAVFLSLTYIFSYYLMLYKFDTTFLSIPSSWFGYSSEFYVVFALPYVALVFTVVLLFWWVYSVAFKPGVIPLLWILCTAVGILSDIGLLVYAFHFKLLHFPTIV